MPGVSRSSRSRRSDRSGAAPRNRLLPCRKRAALRGGHLLVRGALGWGDLVAQAEQVGSSAVAARWEDGAEQSWPPEGGVVECMSMTKFVVGAVLGLVVDVSELGKPLATWIDEWAADERGQITLAHVVTHRTGLEVLPSSAVYAADSITSLVLGLQPTVAPGPFSYTNAAIHLAALVIERRANRQMQDVAAERLFSRLGITEWHWQSDSQGFPFCMAGLHLSAASLARIGSLYLTSGRFGGEQVLPEEWVTRTPPSPPGEVGICCFADYAWIDRSADQVAVGPRTGYGHTGDYGQHLSIQPDRGLVAVRQRTDYDHEETRMWPAFAGAVAEHLPRNST